MHCPLEYHSRVKSTNWSRAGCAVWGPPRKRTKVVDESNRDRSGRTADGLPGIADRAERGLGTGVTIRTPEQQQIEDAHIEVCQYGTAYVHAHYDGKHMIVMGRLQQWLLPCPRTMHDLNGQDERRAKRWHHMSTSQWHLLCTRQH